MDPRAIINFIDSESPEQKADFAKEVIKRLRNTNYTQYKSKESRDLMDTFSALLDEYPIPNENLQKAYSAIKNYILKPLNTNKRLFEDLKSKMQAVLFEQYPMLKYECELVSDSKASIVREEFYKDFAKGYKFPLSGAGVVVCTIYGFFKGCSNAVTRTPISIAEQKEMIKQLDVINHNTQKQIAILKKVVVEPEKGMMSVHSQSSANLREKLGHVVNEQTVSEQWSLLKAYMLETAEHSFNLKNNGKSQFMSIYKLIKEYGVDLTAEPVIPDLDDDSGLDESHSTQHPGQAQSMAMKRKNK